LEDRGVTIVDRRQTYLDRAVNADRICPGAVLYPGTRLVGARTFIGPGAKIGTEGPTALENTVVGENAEIASGFLSEAVLLRDTRVGSNAHIRAGTLLEEEASTAHAVGLKHTILMSFVTMGSLINFCDALLSGGTSRRDHTEVGSGFIHFNFTPRGESGDKATPSLIGDAVHGAFLRQPRIFLGGMSAIVGPQKVGFGSVTIAGQVLRSEVAAGRMFGDVPRKIDKEVQDLVMSPRRVISLNLEYIGQLFALRAWYREVRLVRIPPGPECNHVRVVTAAAAEVLSICIEERIARLRHFLEERGLPLPIWASELPPCPLSIKSATPYVDHVAWVQRLSESDVQAGSAWLQSVAQKAVADKSVISP
jgi:UDP-N-acetylglucosamine/UDP-N-acetylgalactosamine diphosphorylase